jgi:hypothetical protein
MSKHGTLLASLTAQMEIIEIGTGPDSPISLFPKEITVHSGIVWRDKIYGDRRQICERVEVSTIKYQLFRRPKMKYLLFILNI